MSFFFSRAEMAEMDAAGVTGEPVCRYRLPANPEPFAAPVCRGFSETLARAYEGRGYPAAAALVRDLSTVNP